MDVEQSKHGWRECKTSQNGKVYYYNSVSKVIQWDKPDNLASAGYCVDDNESSIICDSTLIENELYMKVQNLSLFLIRKANIEEQYITKLQDLHGMLQGEGSDADWMLVCRTNNFVIIDFLLSLLDSSFEEDTRDLAVSCLALLSYVHCTLWVDYVDSPAVEYTVSDRLQELLDTVRLLLSHVETLVQVYQDTLSQMRNLPTNTYAGFDERDVKDYDMSDYDTHLIRDRESKMTDLREDKDCVETTLRTYLMLVFQVFSEPISSLQQSSPTECMPPTSSSSPIHSSPNQKGSLESSNTEAILEFIDVLLTCSKLFEEEYLYSLCVHAIAAVDQQLSVAPLTLLSPVSSPLSPGASTVLQGTPTQCVTTPVAARLAFSAMRTHFDLPTGVLHCLNGCGYPKQDDVQSRLVRTLVEHLLLLESTVDTVQESTSGSIRDNRIVVAQFFHTNDIRVLIDICIREVQNIPYDDKESSSSARCMYTSILNRIVRTNIWFVTAEKYRENDIRQLEIPNLNIDNR